MAKTFDKIAYNRKYNHTNYLSFKLQINKKKDKDVITKLNNVPSKTKYIIELIKKDIERED